MRRSVTSTFCRSVQLILIRNGLILIMQFKQTILTSIGLLFKSESRSSTRNRCTLMRPVFLSLANEQREFINVIMIDYLCGYNAQWHSHTVQNV